jgi:hypothetical protein
MIPVFPARPAGFLLPSCTITKQVGDMPVERRSGGHDYGPRFDEAGFERTFRKYEQFFDKPYRRPFLFGLALKDSSHPIPRVSEPDSAQASVFSVAMEGDIGDTAVRISKPVRPRPGFETVGLAGGAQEPLAKSERPANFQRFYADQPSTNLAPAQREMVGVLRDLQAKVVDSRVDLGFFPRGEGSPVGGIGSYFIVNCTRDGHVNDRPLSMDEKVAVIQAAKRISLIR